MPINKIYIGGYGYFTPLTQSQVDLSASSDKLTRDEEQDTDYIACDRLPTWESYYDLSFPEDHPRLVPYDPDAQD